MFQCVSMGRDLGWILGFGMTANSVFPCIQSCFYAVSNLRCVHAASRYVDSLYLTCTRCNCVCMQFHVGWLCIGSCAALQFTWDLCNWFADLPCITSCRCCRHVCFGGIVPLLLQTFHGFVRLASPVLSPLCFQHASMPHGRLCSVFIALAVYREMDALR